MKITQREWLMEARAQSGCMSALQILGSPGNEDDNEGRLGLQKRPRHGYAVTIRKVHVAKQEII